MMGTAAAYTRTLVARLLLITSGYFQLLKKNYGSEYRMAKS
jgi:hypothetical protein